MLKAGLVIAALALELSNLPAIVWNDTGGEALAWVIVRHGAASALLAWLAWDWLPPQAQVSRARAIALLFNFAFFVPVLGLPGLVIAVLVAGPPGSTSFGTAFATVAVPEFDLPGQGQGEEGVHLAIKSALDMAQLPAPRRLKFLIALQAVPPRIATRLLHPMLGDVSDDVRLLAYGLLDAKERKIAKDIDREISGLEAAQGDAQRLVFLRGLAELYWELAYAGLAQGDHRARVLDQALHYTEAALVLAPADYGILFLRGRILQEMNRDDEAYRVLQRAMKEGLPESRALPYIAEIQFGRRDYEQARASLIRMSGFQTAPVMSSVIDFWRQGAERARGVPAVREHA